MRSTFFSGKKKLFDTDVCRRPFHECVHLCWMAEKEFRIWEILFSAFDNEAILDM